MPLQSSLSYPIPDSALSASPSFPMGGALTPARGSSCGEEAASPLLSSSSYSLGKNSELLETAAGRRVRAGAERHVTSRLACGGGEVDQKPRENRLFSSLHILLISPFLSVSLPTLHGDIIIIKKKKLKRYRDPEAERAFFEVDTSGSLRECGIPGPKAGGGAGTSRDSRNPRRSGVLGDGCDSRQRRLLSAS